MVVRKILKTHFGYDSFRPQQEEIIQTVMRGNDCLVLMPTGGGKSLCYQIPALAMQGTAVVVSPLISLMKDQVEALNANGIPAAALYSANDQTADAIVRRRCASGDLKLVYVSPERLLAEVDFLLADMKISLFAIDEAHCISQWGHDFRPEYTQLNVLHEKFVGVPIMALTATADKITRNDIVRQLCLHEPAIFISSFDRPNLSLSVKRGYSAREKLSFMVNFIRARPFEPGIIYCLSRKNTESVATELRKKGISAASYHAGMTTGERNSVQEDFKNDRLQVVCATIAFGMGIDKANVRWIVHYNMPKSIENFYQEIGRAGRDGAPADTVLFYSLADIIQLSQFAKQSGQQQVNMSKLKRMQEYAESSVCRRRILLNYFNEQRDHDCGHCDVCEHPPQRFDGTIVAQKALSAVARTEEQARVGTVIEILRGMGTPTVMRNGYNRLKTYGVGRDMSVRDWQDYLLQLLQMGFVDIAYDEDNVVKINPSGWEVLRGQRTVQLAVVEHRDERQAPSVRKRVLRPEIPAITIPGMQTATGVEDTALFEALRKLRLELATAQGFPAYVVLSDKVLHQLAVARPTTVEAFGQIPGIGDFKREKYGELFTQLIRKYVR